MKKGLGAVALVVLIIVLTMEIVGPPIKKEASGKDAIYRAQNMPTAGARTEYLLEETKAFLHAQEPDQAIVTAQYILANIDQDSEEARMLLRRAKSDMTIKAKKAIEDVKKELGEKKKAEAVRKAFRLPENGAGL